MSANQENKVRIIKFSLLSTRPRGTEKQAPISVLHRIQTAQTVLSLQMMAEKVFELLKPTSYLLNELATVGDHLVKDTDT